METVRYRSQIGETVWYWMFRDEADDDIGDIAFETDEEQLAHVRDFHGDKIVSGAIKTEQLMALLGRRPASRVALPTGHQRYVGGLHTAWLRAKDRSKKVQISGPSLFH